MTRSRGNRLSDPPELRTPSGDASAPLVEDLPGTALGCLSAIRDTPLNVGGN
jgi:hypothetical protein